MELVTLVTLVTLVSLVVSSEPDGTIPSVTRTPADLHHHVPLRRQKVDRLVELDKDRPAERR